MAIGAKYLLRFDWNSSWFVKNRPKNIKMMYMIDFNTQLQEHASALKSFAFRFTREDSLADDLLQDTMLKAIRYYEKYQEGTNLKGWLFTIMRNTFINDYRKQHRIQGVVTQQEEISSANLMKSSSVNLAEGKFAMADIQFALSKLPKSCYDPFIQYFEGYKYHEIADKLNIPVGTVKTRIHQARLLLKKSLKNYK